MRNQKISEQKKLKQVDKSILKKLFADGNTKKLLPLQR